MPSGPTPAAPRETLYLSNLDDVVGARVFTPTVYFFASDDQKPVMKTRQDALASVLVPFYPFSGRLREIGNGKLEVFFWERPRSSHGAGALRKVLGRSQRPQSAKRVMDAADI
ncbi:hypothetical protein ACFX10_017718 [Malus domestica]